MSFYFHIAFQSIKVPYSDYCTLPRVLTLTNSAVPATGYLCILYTLTKSDHFPVQHYWNDFYNGEAVCYCEVGTKLIDVRLISFFREYRSGNELVVGFNGSWRLLSLGTPCSVVEIYRSVWQNVAWMFMVQRTWSVQMYVYTVMRQW
jgi:hypothetical protein